METDMGQPNAPHRVASIGIAASDAPRPHDGRTARRLIASVLVLYGLSGVAYSLLIPPWEAPDESAHYRVALYIAKRGVHPPPKYNQEASQPPVYYWLASVPLRLLHGIDPELARFYRPKTLRTLIAPRFDWNPENYRFLPGLQLLRWINVAFGGLALYLIFAACRRAAPGAPAVPLAAVLIVGLKPQFLHISASVSNDPLAVLAGASLFWITCRVCLEPLRWRLLAAGALAAAAFPILIKLTVLPMSVAAVLAIVSKSREYVRVHLLGLALAAAVLVVLAALDPAAFANLWRNLVWRGLYVRPNAFDNWTGQVLMRASSYWALLGAVSLGFHPNVAKFLTVSGMVSALASVRVLLPARSRGRARAVAVSLAGAMVAITSAAFGPLAVLIAPVVAGLWRSLRRSQEEFSPNRLVWACTWLAVAVGLLMVSKNLLATPAAQGRHLFPVDGPLALLMASGWFVVIGPRFGRYLPGLVAFVMIALNAILLTYGVIPVYYQPFLDD
jgi:hypothetical protein